MYNKIGFNDELTKEKTEAEAITNTSENSEKAVKSVVRVYFSKRNLTCSYYNDSFDLKKGDIVYVDGKLEGMRGEVVDVSYTFKIRLSDYKRVTAKADTSVTGTLNLVGSHFITFDSSAIAYDKVLSWFKAPKSEEEEYVSGNDDTSFPLDDIFSMNISNHAAHEGNDCYQRGRVVYISVDGTQGKAIVEDGEVYEVEFTYSNSQIVNLVCSCYCTDTCYHEFAAMLQLKEMLKYIEENYSQQYEESGYFAAIGKPELFALSLDCKTSGSITLG